MSHPLLADLALHFSLQHVEVASQLSLVVGLQMLLDGAFVRTQAEGVAILAGVQTLGCPHLSQIHVWSLTILPKYNNSVLFLIPDTQDVPIRGRVLLSDP